MDDLPVLRMRNTSGNVSTDDLLVQFLYLLARSEVPTGVIDQIIDYQLKGGTADLTNGWLGEWAKDAAERLRW